MRETNTYTKAAPFYNSFIRPCPVQMADYFGLDRDSGTMPPSFRKGHFACGRSIKPEIEDREANSPEAGFQPGITSDLSEARSLACPAARAIISSAGWGS